MTESRCESCDGPLPPGANFCPTCGVRQEDAPKTTPAAAPAATAAADATVDPALTADLAPTVEPAPTPAPPTVDPRRRRRTWIAVPLALIIVALVIYGGVRAAGLVDPNVPDTDRAVDAALDERGLDCKVDDDVDADDGKSIICSAGASAGGSAGDSAAGDDATISIDVEDDDLTTVYLSRDGTGASAADVQQLLTKVGEQLGWDADTAKAMVATKDEDGIKSSGNVSWGIHDIDLRITVAH